MLFVTHRQLVLINTEAEHYLCQNRHLEPSIPGRLQHLSNPQTRTDSFVLELNSDDTVKVVIG